MSPDLFPKYLKDTSLLYRISYEELKTLVVQYPYCQNLRYLLLVKSKMDGNGEQDRNMKMASAYSQDRTQLYLLLKDDLKEAKKDFEFLDLNHAVSDDSHPELELPILDFSNGIEVEESKKNKKSKKSKKISEGLDLFLETSLAEEPNDKTFDFTGDEDENSILQKGYDTENVSDDVLSLFEEEEVETEEDILAKAALTALATVTTIPETEEIVTDDWESPLVPPAIDFSFAFVEETQELQEEKEILPALVLPLVPPTIDLSFALVEEVQEVIAEKIPLVLPLVPPNIDLGFTLVENKEKEAIAEEIPLALPLVPPSVDLGFTLIEHHVEETIIEQEDLVFPLIPPSIDLAFAQNIAIEEVAEEIEEESDNDDIDQSIQAALERLANAQRIEAEKAAAVEEQNVVEIQEAAEPIVLENIGKESNFGDEIDQSIQAALERLANAQKIELEEEEAEEEARIAAIIKKEMILEGIIDEKEAIKAKEEKNIEYIKAGDKPSDDESKTDHQGPMPKASFNSWLKQMAAPTPSLGEKEMDTKSTVSKDIPDVPKKKKSKKKKKKTIIHNEGSRLIKAIKARQEQQRKEESSMMLARKKKVIELAERSLKENEEIVSETLAKILVIQGKKGKAEHMYRKLMLKFPKKSSFFAAEIEKILK